MIGFRVDADEHEAIKQFAASKGLSIADMMREAFNQYANSEGQQ